MPRNSRSYDLYLALLLALLFGLLLVGILISRARQFDQISGSVETKAASSLKGQGPEGALPFLN